MVHILRDFFKSFYAMPHRSNIVIIIIIIIYHDFLPPPRRGSHVMSDNTHTHTQS